MSILGIVVVILVWFLIIGQEFLVLDLIIIIGVKKNMVCYFFRFLFVLCSFWLIIKFYFFLSICFSFYFDGEEDLSCMVIWNYILFYFFENFNFLFFIYWGFMFVIKRCRFGCCFYLNFFLVIFYQLNFWLVFELVIVIYSMRFMFLILILLDYYCLDWSKVVEGQVYKELQYCFEYI